MSNRRRNNVHAGKANILPPIIQDDDSELPFFRSDIFSDISINVGQRKVYTSRCLLAYNSPVFDKQLATLKKQHDLDWSNRNLDDVIELLCYLDPRVPYTITAESAKQLLPLAEEFEMYKLRLACENALFTAYEKIRKEHRLGHMPSDVNEEYLVLADRYKFSSILHLCIDEYVNAPQDKLKTIVDSDILSESVKLMILEKKYKRLNTALERERKYKQNMDSNVNEEHLVVADRYKFGSILHLCIDEYVNAPQDKLKTIVDSDILSESLKLMILEKKYKRLNTALERERKYKHNMDCELKTVSPRKRWTQKFDLY